MIHVWIPWIICFFLRRLQWMKKESGDLRENTREAEGEAHTRLLWFGRYVLLTEKNLILSGSVGGQGWFLYSCEGFRLWESVSALFPKFFQKVAIHSWLINILTPPIPGLHWKACLPNAQSSTISDRLLCSICKSTNLPSPPTRSSASTSSVLLIVHPQTSFVRSFKLSNSWQNSWRDFSLPIFEVS